MSFRVEIILWFSSNPIFISSEGQSWVENGKVAKFDMYIEANKNVIFMSRASIKWFKLLASVLKLALLETENPFSI